MSVRLGNLCRLADLQTALDREVVRMRPSDSTCVLLCMQILQIDVLAVTALKTLCMATLVS